MSVASEKKFTDITVKCLDGEVYFSKYVLYNLSNGILNSTLEGNEIKLNFKKEEVNNYFNYLLKYETSHEIQDLRFAAFLLDDEYIKEVVNNLDNIIQYNLIFDHVNIKIIISYLNNTRSIEKIYNIVSKWDILYLICIGDLIKKDNIRSIIISLCCWEKGHVVAEDNIVYWDLTYDQKKICKQFYNMGKHNLITYYIFGDHTTPFVESTNVVDFVNFIDSVNINKKRPNDGELAGQPEQKKKC